LIDCKPETKLMPQAPAHFSRWAKMVYGLPAWMRTRIEKTTGAAKRIDEIDPQGKETGKTLGFIFYRGT
jgi:hypothetical protein